jgi:GNAT superfamily N-acetyltransferase
MASEKNQVVGWVKQQFHDGWAAECDLAFCRQPIACMIAVCDDRLAGFACHDSTYRNYFGPIGVHPDFRQKAVGRTLLLAALTAMGRAGYAYAIIGNAGPKTFFEKCVGAVAIPGSTPGIYPRSIK